MPEAILHKSTGKRVASYRVVIIDKDDKELGRVWLGGWTTDVDGPMGTVEGAEMAPAAGEWKDENNMARRVYDALSDHWKREYYDPHQP